MHAQATWVNPLPDQTAGWTWDGGLRPQAQLLQFAPFPIGRSQPFVRAHIESSSSSLAVGGGCAKALDAACAQGGDSAAGVIKCDACAGDHQHTLREASCTANEVQKWCAARIAPQQRLVEDCQRLEQHPKLQMSDEGAVAVSSIADKAFSNRLVQVQNEWETFGPLSNRSTLFNATQQYVEWFGASIGVPKFCAGGCAYVSTSLLSMCHPVKIGL